MAEAPPSRPAEEELAEWGARQVARIVEETGLPPRDAAMLLASILVRHARGLLEETDPARSPMSP